MSPRTRTLARRKALAAAATLLTVGVLAVGTSPGGTGAYFTSTAARTGNTLAAATLGAVTNPAATRNSDGTTTLTWDAATGQPWATSNSVTTGVTYSLSSTISNGCSGSTTNNTLTGSWKASSNCTIGYQYNQWVAPTATVTLPPAPAPRLVATISVGNHPTDVALTPDGKKGYVANSDGSSNSAMSIIDTAKNVAPNAFTMQHPTNAAVSPTDSIALVVGYDGSNGGMIYKISTTSNTILRTYTLPTTSLPTDVAIAPSGSFAYVTARGASSLVYRVNLQNDGVTSFSVGTNPSAVAFSPDGGTAYVVNNYDNTISVVDTATNNVRATISGNIGGNPNAIAMAPNGKYAYITNGDSGSVSVLDTKAQAISQVITLGTNTRPAGVAISPNGDYLYVTGAVGLYQIDTASNAILNTVPVGNDPRGVAISSDGATAYVTNRSDNTVSVLSLQ